MIIILMIIIIIIIINHHHHAFHCFTGCDSVKALSMAGPKLNHIS